VNSELATNNKQTLVIHDTFKDTRNDKTENVSGVKTSRVGETVFEMKGFNNPSEIDAHNEWKKVFEDVAKLNSKFKIKRGGMSYPNGVSIDQSGSRAENPTLKNILLTVENEFSGYSGVPARTSGVDEVSEYVKVPDHGETSPAQLKGINEEHVVQGAGNQGSEAPGVLKYGPSKSAATEEGDWSSDKEAQNIGDEILKKQEELNEIEKNMGEGGDEISFTKRSKLETVGAAFNDYPSIRADFEGRSQPLEMLVSKVGVFKNHDFAPVVEQVDNSSNFPCGNDTKIVGNAYKRSVGSGGVEIKTTGNMEFGSATLKIGSKQIHINANLGLHLASESFVEIQSLKSIILRSNRQILIESSLGIKDNITVAGGAYIEGETYLNHVTAPLEVQQTEDTLLTGQFNTTTDRSLFIGETLIAGTWYPVYASASPDLIACYPHSHHFNNIPLRLMKSNEEMRCTAIREGINRRGFKTQSLQQMHEKKLPEKC